MEAPPAEPEKDEEDDMSLPVADGARCKRRACGATWEGQDVSRGDGEKAKCRYHPLGVSFSHVQEGQNLTDSPSSTRERNTTPVAPNAKSWNLTSS
jgi:hypothetical protein